MIWDTDDTDMSNLLANISLALINPIGALLKSEKIVL